MFKAFPCTKEMCIYVPKAENAWQNNIDVPTHK